MSSQRRIDASRANGARSRGPVTPEGKARSAQNALRHGLLSRTVVLQDEDPEAFESTLNALIHRFQPVDDVELSLVEDMAAAQWRQHRIAAIETRLLDNAAAASTEHQSIDRIVEGLESLSADATMALVNRYENRQVRMFHRAMKAFLLLRKEILPIEPNPISEQLEEPPPEPAAPPVAAPVPVEIPPQPAPAPPPHPVPAPAPPWMSPETLSPEAARLFRIMTHPDYPGI